MKIVVVPDSFKETLSNVQVASAMEEGWRTVFPQAEIIAIPISDGGEGLIDTVLHAYDGEIITTEVSHPYTEYTTRVTARYAWIPSRSTIVVESAECIGIHLVPKELRNPLHTTSYGLGELLSEIYARFVVTKKSDKILLGVGGSVTVDGGMGMAQALGVTFYDEGGEEIPHRCNGMHRVGSLDASSLIPFPTHSILVASDVHNPLYGTDGAARVFGPQKGATPEIVELLEKGMMRYAHVISHDMELDEATQVNFNRAGAAGGLGAALAVYCHANVTSGIETMMAEVQLEEKMKHADVVLTGEGRVDGQSMQGKVISGILSVCKKHGVPMCIIAGALGEKYESLYDEGVHALFSATMISSDWSTIVSHAYTNVVYATRAVAQIYALSHSRRKTV